MFGKSPEQQAGIVVFIIFMLLMTALIILGNHSKVFGKEEDMEDFVGITINSDKPISNTEKSKQVLQEELEIEIARAFTFQTVMCRKRSDGDFVYHLFCREDKLCLDSLKEYAKSIVKYSMQYNVDPWLAAAVAVHESNLNAYAKGSIGERTIFQLHPWSPWGKQSRFVKNGAYRLKCKKITGHCQDEPTELAIKLLSDALNQCKTVNGALSLYNGGKCQKKSTSKYVKKVKEKMNNLKRNNFDIQWCG